MKSYIVFRQGSGNKKEYFAIYEIQKGEISEVCISRFSSGMTRGIESEVMTCLAELGHIP